MSVSRRCLPLAVVALWLAWAPLSVMAEKAEMRGMGTFTVPEWFKTSFLDLREDAFEAAQSGKRLLIYFGQDGCPYCAELFNNNFSQKHIVEYAREHFDAIEINMWGDRDVTDFDGEVLTEKRLAAKHKVWFTPTILFFDGEGQQVLRVNGYYPPHRFLAALKYVAEKHEGKRAFREYYAALNPPPAQGRLHSQPFFASPPHDLTRVKDRPIAVFFEQKDCAGCDRLHEKIMPLPATQAQVRRFHAIQLDRWSETPVVTPSGKRTTARAWADALNVTYVPSVVLFDRGREVIRTEAMLRAFHVQSVLDYAASGAYKRQPSLQRFIHERADRLRERGVAVDLWK